MNPPVHTSSGTTAQPSADVVASDASEDAPDEFAPEAEVPPSIPAPTGPRRAYQWRTGHRVRYAVETVHNAERPRIELTVRSIVTVENARLTGNGAIEQRVRLQGRSMDGSFARPARTWGLPGEPLSGSATVERDPLGSVLARTGDEPVAQTAALLFPEFPPNGVAVGGRWEVRRRYELALGLGMDFHFTALTTWQLRSVEQTPAGELLVLGIQLRLLLDPNSTVAGMPVDAEGRAEGEVTLAPGRGLLVASTLGGNIVLQARGNPTTRTIPVNFREEVRLAGEEG